MDQIQFWQYEPRIHLSVTMPRASRRNLQFNEHSHPFHEIGLLLEGDCWWHIGGRRERLRPDDLILVPAGVKHHERTAARARARIAWIGFDFTDGHADVPPALTTPLAAHDHAADLRRLFEVVCAERQGNALGHAERARLAMSEILILLSRLAPAGARAGTRTAVQAARAPQLVRSAALTMAGNLAQPMRIRDLAHYHSLSPSHFALLFRRHQGETPRRYLQKTRLERAATLLEEGNLTVKEIAAACGYVDAAHFCHAFKAANGLTPKQYRRRETAAAADRRP